MAKRSAQVPGRSKNAARDFTAPPSSIISFSTDPITSAQFLGCCTRRYYINNNPAGRIIGSNEKKERKEERKGGEGGEKKESNPLPFLSRSAFPFTRLHARKRTDTYFIFLTRIRKMAHFK